jgi:hypothetical protein
MSNGVIGKHLIHKPSNALNIQGYILINILFYVFQGHQSILLTNFKVELF